MKIGSISLLSVILLCMTGCSKNAVSAEPTDSNKTGMGRYVEQTIAAKEEMGRIDGFTKQEDGSLIAFSYNHGVFCSEDEGTTWKKEASWFDAMNGEYLLDVAASAQGEYGYIYIPPENTEEVTESTEKISEDPGEKTEQETEQDVEETSEEDESWVKDQMTLNAHYVYVDKNGQSEELEIQLPESGGENYLNDMVFLEDGTLIGAEADTGTVYAIDKESGKTTELFTADAYINYLTVTNQYILAITRDQIYIYNIQTGRLEDTDQTLTDFIKQQKLDFTYTSEGNLSPLQISEGDSADTVYVACRSGLYRHVIGGSTMEQLIDGSLNTLGSPSVTLLAIYYKTDGSFLACFTGNKLVRYVYDAQMSVVPERELKVYSLYDNNTIRQAISGYQQKNPNVYVNYEVGMSGTDAVTAEDAIKNLNTKLMTKDAPDILILDGLPQDTYMEKGMLLDLSTYMNDIEDQLFTNISNVYEEEGAVYAMPAKFQIPMVIGNKEVIRQITDMASLKEAAEQLRKEQPDGTILGTYQAEELIRLLALVNAPNWVDADGNLDRGALTEFMTKSDHIYELEQSGITEAEKQVHEKENVNFVHEDFLCMDASYTAFNYYADRQALALGKISAMQLNFSNITSVIDVDKEVDYGLWKAGTGNVFIPSAIMSVNAKTQDTQLAVDFIKEVLAKETQSIDLSDGFPVNKEGLTEMEKNPNGDEEFGTIGMIDETGREVDLSVRWPSSEQLQRLEDIMISLDTPNTIDPMLLHTVEEYAPKVWQGEMSVEEAVNEIVNKMQIRMSE